MIKKMTVKAALDKRNSVLKKYNELINKTPIVGGFSIGAGTPAGYQSDSECLTDQQSYVDQVGGLATSYCILDAAIKQSNATTPLICPGLREGATVAEGLIRQELYFSLDKQKKSRSNQIRSLLQKVAKQRAEIFLQKERAIEKRQIDAELFAQKAAETVAGATEKSTLIAAEIEKYIKGKDIRWLEHPAVPTFVEKLTWLAEDFETELATAIQKSNMETTITVDLTGCDDAFADPPGIL